VPATLPDVRRGEGRPGEVRRGQLPEVRRDDRFDDRRNYPRGGYGEWRDDRWDRYWRHRQISHRTTFGVWATPPRLHVTIGYRHRHYWYAGGFYYWPFGSRYVLVIPPVGIVVPLLPPTYSIVYVRDVPYYYASGSYYVATPESATIVAGSDEGATDYEPGINYEVVAPPLGAAVEELPEDAAAVEVAGKTYFFFDGTWYRPFYSGSEVVYVVVPEPEDAAEPGPTPGTTADSLPEGAKKATVDGQDYYVLNGTWYLEFSSDGDTVYLVVPDPTKPLDEGDMGEVPAAEGP
jgi:hypothetical protein